MPCLAQQSQHTRAEKLFSIAKGKLRSVGRKRQSSHGSSSSLHYIVPLISVTREVPSANGDDRVWNSLNSIFLATPILEGVETLTPTPPCTHTHTHLPTPTHTCNSSK